MPHVAGEIVIRRPVDEVFDFVADERNEPRFNPRMRRAEKLTDGPVGHGTRFEAEIERRPRPSRMTVELTGFDRPYRLASTMRLPAIQITGVLVFLPVAEGTRMRWDWTLSPRGPLRLLSPLVAAVGRRQERAIWTNLKHLLENGSGTP